MKTKTKTFKINDKYTVVRFYDKNHTPYQVWEKIMDSEHPFFDDPEPQLSHLVFNCVTVSEIQQICPELKNCNELFLL